MGVDMGRVELPKRLLTESEVAEILQLRCSTLSAWRCTGRVKLRFIRAGRLIRYIPDDVVKFIEDRANDTQQPAG